MIVRFLKWALSKFEDKPAPTAWPFPTMSEDFEPRPCEKKKPTVKKATTRTPKITAKKTVKKAK